VQATLTRLLAEGVPCSCCAVVLMTEPCAAAVVLVEQTLQSPAHPTQWGAQGVPAAAAVL
jgi:hypothetical protein